MDSSTTGCAGRCWWTEAPPGPRDGSRSRRSRPGRQGHQRRSSSARSAERRGSDHDRDNHSHSCYKHARPVRQRVPRSSGPGRPQGGRVASRPRFVASWSSGRRRSGEGFTRIPGRLDGSGTDARRFRGQAGIRALRGPDADLLAGGPGAILPAPDPGRAGDPGPRGPGGGRTSGSSVLLWFLVAAAATSYLATVAWGLGLPPSPPCWTSWPLCSRAPGSSGRRGQPARRLGPDGPDSRVSGSAGATLHSMLLGHHYLVAPVDDHPPLTRSLDLIAGGPGGPLRARRDRGRAAHAAAAGTTWSGQPVDATFLAIRWGMGIVGAAVSVFLARRTAAIRSTQSAAGFFFFTSRRSSSCSRARSPTMAVADRSADPSGGIWGRPLFRRRRLSRTAGSITIDERRVSDLVCKWVAGR